MTHPRQNTRQASSHKRQGKALPVFGGDPPSIITGSDEFEFFYRFTLPEIKGEARLWMPLAKTDAFQAVAVEETSIPIRWEKVRDADNASR